jgi:hypothetical protein
MTLPAGRDPATGQFTTGNRFWEARSSHGRNPKFDAPDMLEDAIRQYFEWNESNPLFKDNLVTFQGQATHEPLAQMRAMTIHAMCMYIGVTRSTWNEWKTSRSDFSDVMTWAEDVIYRQKFEGASADLLNPNIIARDLGLADKKMHGNDPDNPLPSAVSVSLTMTPEQAAEAYAAQINPQE